MEVKVTVVSDPPLSCRDFEVEFVLVIIIIFYIYIVQTSI